MAKRQCQKDPAGLIGLTDRKSLLALRNVGPESEAESVHFHGRRVTKVGPEVKHGPEGWGPLNKGVQEAHLGAAGRFSWRRTPRPVRCRSGKGSSSHGSRVFTRRVGVGMHAHPLLPEPEMAQDALDDILLSMSETMRISREHFGHRSGSASHTFLINSRHFLEGMRRGS